MISWTDFCGFTGRATGGGGGGGGGGAPAGGGGGGGAVTAGGGGGAIATSVVLPCDTEEAEALWLNCRESPAKHQSLCDIKT